MQTGNIYRHGKWWVLRYYETVLVDGKPKRNRVVKKLALVDDAHRSEGSVRKLADEILAPLNSGASPESVDTVARFISDVFLPYCKQVDKPSTARGYAHVFNLVKKHDAFCNLPLRQVRTADIHKLLNVIMNEKPQRSESTVRSRSSMRNLRNFLSKTFKYAKNLGMIAENPVTDVITPQGAQARETYAYSLDEVSQMRKVLAEPGRTLVLTAALTGLSRSELQGLRWDDFAGDKVNVGRAVWNGIVSDTKTVARKSSVPLLPVVAAALDDHRKRNGFNAWVFHGETGKPLRLDNYAKRIIRPTLKKAGLKWHGYHSLRRGLATNLHRLGCPAKTAQAILRHANVKTTLDFYTKVGSDTSQKEMAKLGLAFKKSEKEAKRKTA